LLPIKKQTEAEKTTVRVNLSLINLLKSDIKFLTMFSVSLLHINCRSFLKYNPDFQNKESILIQIYERNLLSKGYILFKILHGISRKNTCYSSQAIS
jgi:hypothetical protein